MVRLSRAEHCDTRNPRERVLEQLQILRGQLRSDERESGQIPAGPRQTRSEPRADWITDANEDNRHGARRGPGSVSCRGAEADDRPRLHGDAHSRQSGEDLASAFGETPLQREAAALDIAQIAETLLERVEHRVHAVRRSRIESKEHDEVTLRLDGERRSEHGSQSNGEGATVHSSDLRLAAMLAPH